VGAYRNEEQICEKLGADSVRYLPLEHLIETCKAANVDFCTGCFSGKYPYTLEDAEADKLKFE
jgi:amidophosphoribosyltransferase